MQYTIEGFQQKELVRLGLDVIDAVLLKWFAEFRDFRLESVDGFYVISYADLIIDLPILKTESPSVLLSRFDKMVKAGVLCSYVFQDYVLYRIGSKYESLSREPRNEFYETERTSDPGGSGRSGQSSRPGYVYLIECDGFYKIGVTRRSPNDRLKDLQSQSPHDMRIVGSIQTDDPYELERSLHEKYFEQSISGEWFKFDEIPEEFGEGV